MREENLRDSRREEEGHQALLLKGSGSKEKTHRYGDREDRGLQKEEGRRLKEDEKPWLLQKRKAYG